MVTFPHKQKLIVHPFCRYLMQYMIRCVKHEPLCKTCTTRISMTVMQPMLVASKPWCTVLHTHLHSCRWVNSIHRIIAVCPAQCHAAPLVLGLHTTTARTWLTNQLPAFLKYYGKQNISHSTQATAKMTYHRNITKYL